MTGPLFGAQLKIDRFLSSTLAWPYSGFGFTPLQSTPDPVWLQSPMLVSCPWAVSCLAKGILQVPYSIDYLSGRQPYRLLKLHEKYGPCTQPIVS